MDTFLLPLALVFALVFVARRFVRHRETFIEHQKRVRKTYADEHEEIKQYNTLLDTEDTLPPLAIAMDELIKKHGYAQHHTQESGPATALAKVDKGADSIFLTLTNSKQQTKAELTVSWQRHAIYSKGLPPKTDKTRGIFTLQETGKEPKKYTDLAMVEDALNKFFAAHSSTL